MDLKKILNGYPRRSADNIIKMIQPYDVVSFDVFDTLLKRDVDSESDVFDLVERKYNSTHDKKIDGFKEFRKKAESEAREKNVSKEVTIDDIYACLNNKTVGEAVVNELIAADLCSIEKEVETAVCTANQLMMAVFDYCKETGKRILIISDMYWPASFVEELLRNNGIVGYDAIYVSAEYGVQKRQKGALFKVVAEKENTGIKRWVHIGDNKKGDYLSAKSAGIATVNIATHYRNTEYLHKSERTDLDKKVISSFINNRISVIDATGNGEKIEYNDVKLGYEIYGPLLYFFVKWLHDGIPQNVTVLFFARDCYVVKKAYEALYGAEDRYKYFLGSRKSLILAALHKDASLETVARMLKSEQAQMTVHGFLTKLNLNPEDYESEAVASGLTLSTVIYRDRLTENQYFVEFYNCILPDVIDKANQNYEGIKNYINELNCTKDVVVVDIGWRCTMQFCLQEVFPEYNWKGYYLGVREDAVVDAGSQAEGFYLNGENDIEKRCFLASMTALIEIFFSAPHGSVTGYSGNGEVLFAPYECQDDEEHRKFFNDIQNGALRFTTDFGKAAVSEFVNATCSNMLLGLEVLCEKANRRELKKIGNYPFHLGVGVVNAADPKSLWKYIMNPKFFLYDFSNSTWKVAFLKRLIKLKLPYYKIFCWIYRHKE